MEAFLEESQHLNIELEAIKLATCSFDNSKVIGKGGFGEVYKGVLSRSKGKTMVAFKRLDRNCGQGDPEFWKEILILSGYKHENLITLEGFCDENGEKILVYEHAYHGSLDRHLSSTTLTWKQRLKICIGAAMGLCYLHDPKETQQRVLHRDIKSSNILLDESWNAKVSDMGLSKIGPANQLHTFLISNVVGTPGYIDPLYMDTYSLTKESDVYSFGVVLFEVLCGRLCFKYNNGRWQSLVQLWKKSYKQKKLNEIIFKDLKQHMDPSSLEIFSDIAYQCLQKSREGRPKMSRVVEKLELALQFQEISEDYEEMAKIVVPPLVYKTKEELKMLLSKGILVNGGKTWFWLDDNGKHCEMISAEECLIPIQFASPTFFYYGGRNSRFQVDLHAPYYWDFKIHLRTQFLSPHIPYTVNLVFHFGSRTEYYLGFSYILGGVTNSSTLGGVTNSSTPYLVYEREDGWSMTELFQFTSDSRNFDVEIMFQCRNPLAVKGIKFQPLERLNGNTNQRPSSTDVSNVNQDWVSCDKCEKWRLLPPGLDPSTFPEKWKCSMLDWLPGMNQCNISEEETTKAIMDFISSRVVDVVDCEKLKKKHKPTKIVWDDVIFLKFLDLCVDEVKKGNKRGTCFKKIGWLNIEKGMEEITGKKYETKQIKNKWENMKSKWKLYDRLVRLETGIGGTRSLLDASDGWWDEKINENNKFSKFRDKDLSIFESHYALLFRDSVAVGDQTMTPLQFQNKTNPNDDQHEENMEGKGDSDEINLRDDKPLFRSFPEASSSKRKNKGIANNRSTKTKTSSFEEKLDVVLDALSTKSTQTFPPNNPSPTIADCMDIVSTFPGFNAGSKQYSQALFVLTKKQNREAFMYPPTNEAKLEFLKVVMKD